MTLPCRNARLALATPACLIPRPPEGRNRNATQMIDRLLHGASQARMSAPPVLRAIAGMVNRENEAVEARRQRLAGFAKTFVL